MATYVPAKRATEYIFYVGLVSQSNTKTLQSNPTIAAGDFQVSKDGGALANLSTLPAVTPASSKMVKITLSSTEMTADNVTVVCSDASGAQWCDLIINIQTAARQIDDLAFPNTSGRGIDVDATGGVEITAGQAVGSIASGGITAASFAAGSINAAAVAADVTTELRAVASGTADSGSTTTMVDAARTEADTDYWAGDTILFTSGNIAGQERVITAFDPATDTITFTPATTQAVTTQTYEILPRSRAILAGITHTSARIPNVTLTDTVTTYTGNTPQTGDSFARLGAPAGVSVSADVAAVKADTAAILVDTGTDGVLLAAGSITAAVIAPDAIDADALAANAVTEIQSGLATAASIAALNNLSAAQVNAEVDTALADVRLDELLAADSDIDGAAPPTVGSVFHELLSKTAGSFTYDQTTDSLEAIRDRGDAAWITGGGGSITDILNVVPLLPPSVDLANTATWRLGLMLTNALDDLPTTAEITPGTISIDRKAIGATSWTSIVADAACSESAGMVYYDAAFNSGAGYAEGDSLRITFKSQKITVAANDYEVTDTTGRIFYTEIRQTERGTNNALLAASYTAPDNATISAIAGYVDTEVTAIKAVTDLLPNAGALTTIQADLDDIQARLPVALTAGGNMKADALALSGDTVAADNAEAFFDGTGYAGTNNVIPQVTTVTGAVGSVSGAVGSVTGAVGSVTGNVGGNVVGSVGSVTAGVTVTTNNDKTGYTLSAAGVDAILDDPITEPVGVFSWASATLRNIIGWNGALARNKFTQTATTATLRNDADNANIAAATVSDDGTTFTRGEYS